MSAVFICDYIRTPIGRYGGALAGIRTDDLATIPIKALMSRNSAADWEQLDDVLLGCTNQAGEDSRNVARMAVLLAGLPVSVSATTINRLCGSGMDAVMSAARAIKAGEADLMIAGGVESMTRAPFAIPKNSQPYSRNADMFDTTIGWRFVNPAMEQQFGVDSMPETAENVAERFAVSREDQDRFAFQSQQKAVRAQQSGRLSKEIVPVDIRDKNQTNTVTTDEHPRADTTLEKLASLAAPFRENGTVTAGNASGINDGAAALILASENGIKQHGLQPIARVVGGATSGVSPEIMGIGPVTATRKLSRLTGIDIDRYDVIELNEAFAAQALCCMRELGIEDDDPRVNPNGGAIALGHPLGMSGARLVGTAALELSGQNKRHALATMCIGVGQGIALSLARE